MNIKRRFVLVLLGAFLIAAVYHLALPVVFPNVNWCALPAFAAPLAAPCYSNGDCLEDYECKDNACWGCVYGWGDGDGPYEVCFSAPHGNCEPRGTRQGCNNAPTKTPKPSTNTPVPTETPEPTPTSVPSTKPPKPDPTKPKPQATVTFSVSSQPVQVVDTEGLCITDLSQLPEDFWPEGRQALERALAEEIIEISVDQPLCIEDPIPRSDAARAALMVYKDLKEYPPPMGYFDDDELDVELGDAELAAKLEEFQALGFYLKLTWHDQNARRMFFPYEPTTRNVGIVWILLSAHDPENWRPLNTTCLEIFDDVECENEFRSWIENAVEAEIYQLGLGPFMYDPDGTYNWVQYLVLLFRAEQLE